MFADEARVAGLVHHPNVVSVLDTGEDDAGPYLVMEYVEGTTVEDLIQTTRQSGELIPVQLCLAIAEQMALGLHATHRVRAPDGTTLTVVHRDISPQNVLLGYDGVVRITDFGIAKLSERVAPRTTTGILKGKVSYMAPEQLRFEGADHRSDLYALGVLLYELLSGEPLYRGNEEQVARQVLTEPPPDIEDERGDVPPALVELLFELLAKDPKLRPASALETSHRLASLRAELAADEGVLYLDAFMRAEFADRRGEERDELARAVRESRHARRRSKLPIAVAALVAALGGAGAAFWLSAGRDAAPTVDAVRSAPAEEEAKPDDRAEPTRPGPARAGEGSGSRPTKAPSTPDSVETEPSSGQDEPRPLAGPPLASDERPGAGGTRDQSRVAEDSSKRRKGVSSRRRRRSRPSPKQEARPSEGTPRVDVPVWEWP
jgi:serine/threonine-protein kinase